MWVQTSASLSRKHEVTGLPDRRRASFSISLLLRRVPPPVPDSALDGTDPDLPTLGIHGVQLPQVAQPRGPGAAGHLLLRAGGGSGPQRRRRVLAAGRGHRASAGPVPGPADAVGGPRSSREPAVGRPRQPLRRFPLLALARHRGPQVAAAGAAADPGGAAEPPHGRRRQQR